jgi:hypothetical protein
MKPSPSVARHRREAGPATLLLATVVLLAAVAPAQGHADFSGQWQLAEPTDVDDHVASRLEVRHSTTGLETLTVARSSRTGVQSSTYQVGIEGGMVGGAVTRFSNAWRGDHLILMQGSYAGSRRDGGPFWEYEEDWSFEADGRLLIISTERTSDAEARTTRLVYQRR